MKEIKKDAEKYRLQVVKESEEIKENAFKEGYSDGFEQWTERLAAFETQIEELHQELQKVIIPIALSAAKKIVGREIELSERAIETLLLLTSKQSVSIKKSPSM